MIEDAIGLFGGRLDAIPGIGPALEWGHRVLGCRLTQAAQRDCDQTEENSANAYHGALP